MRRYLVVANRTLGGEHLLDAVRERLSRGPSAFHVLVPASPPPDTFVASDGEARAAAQRQLDDAVARFRAIGCDEVDGEVGDPNPLEAIRDVLRHQVFDEIILSTLPPGPSRWLKQDLPHRVERSFNVPLTHIVADSEPASA